MLVFTGMLALFLESWEGGRMGGGKAYTKKKEKKKKKREESILLYICSFACIVD